MSTIAPYISDGVAVGQKVALKTHELFWRDVGHGELKALSAFKIEINGRIELAVYKGDLHIYIELLDQDETASTGSCLLQLNEYTDAEAVYTAHKGKLAISAQIRSKTIQIQLGRFTQENMTECKVSGPLDLTAYIKP